MNEDNERWLSDGDCSKCRRKSYCKKECKASRQNTEAIIRDAIRNITGIDKMEDVMERIMR